MRSFFMIISFMLFSFSAYAIPVRWELPPTEPFAGVFGSSDFINPTFALEGSFDYDADTNVYSNIEITRSDTSRVLTQTSCYFGCSDQTGLTFGFVGTYDFETGAQVREYYRMAFDAPLTNAGGAVSLIIGSQFIDCDAYEGCDGGIDTEEGPLATLGGATIVGNVVPIPAAVWLFGSALAGLGLLKRKQSR
jgi:hypothetical protein